MTIQLSTSLRTARAAVNESHIGTTPVLRIFTGSQPANVAAANSGTELVAIDLPSDWATQASGVLSLAGSWTDVAIAAGTVGHFRLYESDGTTCHMQGSCTASGGGGDMTVTGSGSFEVDDVITVETFALTEGGA